MAIPLRLKAFLTQHKIRYTLHKHPLAYTAQEIAAAQHVSGKHLAKCVVVKTDKGLRLVVLPAVQLINLPKLKSLLKAKSLSLAKEADIKQAFPDIEVGAMPPFGNLYDVPTLLEKSLADSENLVCNAGTHTETMTVRLRDFVEHVRPKVSSFGMPVSTARSKKATARSASSARRGKTAGRRSPRAKKSSRSTTK